MKVVQIGSFPIDINLIRGGVEASVYGLSKAQALANDVVVFDVPRGEIGRDYFEEVNEIQIFRFKLPSKNNFSSIFRVSEYGRKIIAMNPDICHLHGSSLFIRYLFKWLTYRNLNCIVTIHGLVHVEKRKLLERKFTLKSFLQYIIQSHAEFQLINIARSIIVDTCYVEKTIQDLFHHKRINQIPEITVIPQGIDDSCFYKKETSIKDLVTILSVGAFVERKGHHLLIEAFSKLFELNHHVRLIIIGSLTSKEYFDDLLCLINSLQLNDYIELICDLDISLLHRNYRSADIFALHSSEESQGIVFCEAMAAGLPVVATRVGGIPDVVEDEVNGLLTSYGDISSFSKSLLELVEEKDRYLKFSNNNMIDSKKYNWKYIESQVEIIYKKMINI